MRLLLTGLQWKLVELLGLDDEAARCVARALTADWDARDGTTTWKIPKGPGRTATIHLSRFVCLERPEDEFIRALSIAHMRRAPRVLLVPESLHGRARALVQAFAELPTMTPQAFRASVLYELITEGEDTPEESLRFLRENMSGHLADPSRPTWFEELDDALRADSHRARVVYLPELHRVGCAMLDVSPAERARCGEARATVRASLLAGRLNNLLRGDWRGAVVLAPGEPAWNAFFAAELGSCYLEMPVMVCEPVGGLA